MDSSKPLAKWVMKRYSILWMETQGKPFSHEDAIRILRATAPLTSVILSELKKAGWLNVQIDPEDTRKRHYVLLSPDTGVRKMAGVRRN